MTIETVLMPSELPALAHRDLRDTACVVFDVLRATSAFVTALQNGAREIYPVREIPEALARRQQQPDALLAGERNGLKIDSDLSRGAAFDFGNSPREFVPQKVRGKTIVSTTTNGTRALRACLGARLVLASSFLNLGATAKFLNQSSYRELLLVCSGTGEGLALEDVLAAGALAGLIGGEYSDATETAARAFASAKADLPAVIATSQNARRLLSIPDLRADVPFCAQRDVFKVVTALQADGAVRVV